MRHKSRRRLFILPMGMLVTTLFLVGEGNRLGVKAAEPSKDGDRQPIVLDRRPLRAIEDKNPVFSAITLDVDRGEVFMTNDNESGDPSIMVFPAEFKQTDSVMEPRRRIAGEKADLGLPCGIAISPQHREIYTVSGDDGDLLTFPLTANGDLPPTRALEVPHASGGIFMDTKHDELYVTTEHSNRLGVYRRTAKGTEDPVRFIQGPNTGLADPHLVYVDNETDEVFVTNHGHWRHTPTGEAYRVKGDGKLYKVRGGQFPDFPGVPEPLGPSTGKFLPPSITVHSRTAQGDAPPLRTIQGPKTGMNLPLGIYRDPVNGQLAVANAGDDSVIFFDGKASGDVAPVRVLKGSLTMLKGPTGVFIDPKRNELWVTNWDDHTTAVFPRTAEGNMKPLRYIRSAPKGTAWATLGRASGIAWDAKRKQVLVSN